MRTTIRLLLCKYTIYNVRTEIGDQRHPFHGARYIISFLLDTLFLWGGSRKVAARGELKIPHGFQQFLPLV